MQIGAQRRLVANVPWGVAVAAVLVGLVGIYNLASAAQGLPTPVVKAQSIYLALGALTVVLVAWVDYRLIQRLAVPIFVVNLLLLVAVKFVGHKAKGAESWLVLGPIRMQPAEFMKIGMVLMMAKYFHDDFKPTEPSYGFLRLVVPSVLAVVPIALVLVQPDLGTALMMVFTAATLILFARIKWTVVVTLLFASALGIGVLWNDYVRPQTEPRFTVVRHMLKKHQDARISGWMDPQSDLKGSNYHSFQSKIAVGSGGVWGKGWTKGTQTALRYLPEQHTDFIFSVWAEEHGFFMCLFLLGLYGALLLAALLVAYNAKDRFGAFVAVGIAAMVFWQVFENVGMVTGLLPVTGITLPLMSYGGSSILSVMLGIGLLINIGMRRHIFS
jgi:rod shape determining protein RodA